MTTLDQTRPLIEAQWLDRLAEAEFTSGEIVGESFSDPYRRVLRVDDRLWKVVLSDLELTSKFRSQDTHGEFAILKALSGTKGVPSVHRLISTDRVVAFEMEELAGTLLEDENPSLLRSIAILTNLLRLVIRLAAQGVGHNGLVTSNILVSGYADVGLVDFDQAYRGPFVRTLMRQVLGRRSDRMNTRGTLLTLTRASVLRLLPPRMVSTVKSNRRRYRSRAEESSGADVAESPRLTKLRGAWDIAAGSNATGAKGHPPSAYYSLGIEDVRLPGERRWESRWHYLQTAVELEDKRVLELGCNQGLLSTWTMREAGATAAFGVDVDGDIVDAARLVADAFDVPAVFQVTDLDSPGEWERELLAFSPDVVFALNVLYWVKDKGRLLRFLGQIPEVVFEGHQDTATEVERLLGVGFTKVRMVEFSERGRAVMVFRR